MITRHARDLHAGDIITHDPDHDRPVRWRVQTPPKIDGFGIAQFDYADLNDHARAGTAWFDGTQDLTVEPAPWLESA